MKIGIDLGGSHIGIGIIEGVELKEKIDKFFTAEDKKNIENVIPRYIYELAHELLEKTGLKLDDIISIGVACPGTVANGKVTSWNLGLKEYDLKSRIEEMFNKPVIVRNDGKCAALVEKKYGAMKDYEDCVFVNIGTGLGGAAFLGGKLLEPKKYSGFEFGHMTLVKDGIECTCGKKGCFERYASMKVFKNNLRKALGLDETTRGEELLKIIRDIKPGDKNYEVIQNTIESFIDNLSIGIVNLINIFEPQVIGIGGSFVHFEDIFLDRLRKKVNGQTQGKSGREDFVIRTAVLGNDAGIIGAIL